MLKERIYEKEIIDDLEFEHDLLIENLQDMEFLNQWLGYNRNLIKSIEKIKNKLGGTSKENPLKIIDLGCGSGDGLRTISQWGEKQKCKLELIGLDGNAKVIGYAKKRPKDHSEISYFVANILHHPEKSKDEYEESDIILLNNVCHHFKDEEILELIAKWKKKTKVAIIINDIHRHFLSYWGMKALGKIFRFSHLTNHDGPLSVKKGFKKNELEKLLQNQTWEYEIRWVCLFRWEVIIWKSK